jgi:hypothetical protein
MADRCGQLFEFHHAEQLQRGEINPDADHHQGGKDNEPAKR